MAKYQCIPCDHQFEAKNGAKPRCPKCLGIHDIEPIAEELEASKSLPKPIVPIAIIAVLLVGVAVYFLLAGDDAETDPQTDVAKVADGDLPSLLVESGVPKAEAIVPFAATEALEDFAKGMSGEKRGSIAMDALFNGIVEMRSAGKWRPFHQREPREEPPLRAAELLDKINAGGEEPYEVTSYELACLLLSLARIQDLDAQMAEILRFEGEGKPADESGKFGRFGVILKESADSQPPLVFDPYAGRSRASAKAEIRVLGDGEAMAPFYAMRAFSLLSLRNTSEALKNNDIAIRLDSTSPYFRMGRGLIFAASGASNEALVEFEKALKQRSDPVTRTNLAEILLLVPTQSSAVRAESEIQTVLAEVPNFGRAHGIWAMILLMKRELEKAEQELAMAERLDPDSPAIALYWAQFYAAQGLGEDAIQKAKTAVRLSHESLSSLIALAGVYRSTARFDEMRKTLDKVLEKAKSPTMVDEIKKVFGYENEVAEGSTPGGGAGADAGLGDFKLKLGEKGGDPGRGGMGEPTGGSRLKLGEGLGSGLGSQKGPSLGGGDLKLDLNMNK